jgi:hypothetical protein
VEFNFVAFFLRGQIFLRGNEHFVLVFLLMSVM